MRSNQVTLRINRYAEAVPESYDSDRQIIDVYADSNNLFEALAVAYNEAMNELQKYEKFPYFGDRIVSNNLTDDRLY